VQFFHQLQLVLDRQLDVDALDAVGVLAHPVQRDDDVFVDLEGVRVARDGGRSRAVEPELLARFRADGDEALAHARVRETHDFRRGQRHGILVVADDVAEQRHLRQGAALGFRRIADGAQVALVQVLQAREAQAGEFRLAALGQAVQVILDLDDRRDRVARLAEEFQRDGARELRHLVQDPAA
jgi:hypothetical protein